MTEKSKVDHPEYYNTGTIEVIDLIEGWGLGFNLGNAVKYICRAGKKNLTESITDLEKAMWYINRARGSGESPSTRLYKVSPYNNKFVDMCVGEDLSYVIRCIGACAMEPFERERELRYAKNGLQKVIAKAYKNLEEDKDHE